MRKAQKQQPDFASFQKEKQGVFEAGEGKIEDRSKEQKFRFRNQ